MTASPPLCDWLRDRAGISPKIMGPTMLWLTQEEVFEVDDLIVLRKEGGLRDGFTRVTAAKIEAALDAIEAPPTEPPKGSVLPMAPPPTNTNSFATPDRASRTRSALNLNPSSPTKAAALQLFTPPPPTALDATPVPLRASVPPKTSALQPSAAAVLLQTGVRRMQACAAASHRLSYRICDGISASSYEKLLELSTRTRQYKQSYTFHTKRDGWWITTVQPNPLLQRSLADYTWHHILRVQALARRRLAISARNLRQWGDSSGPLVPPWFWDPNPTPAQLWNPTAPSPQAQAQHPHGLKFSTAQLEAICTPSTMTVDQTHALALSSPSRPRILAIVVHIQGVARRRIAQRRRQLTCGPFNLAGR